MIKIIKEYIDINTSAYIKPSNGLGPKISKEFEVFVEGLLEKDLICDASTDDYTSNIIDEDPIPFFTAFLLHKNIITEKQFQDLVTGSNYKRGCESREDHPELKKIGVKIDG